MDALALCLGWLLLPVLQHLLSQISPLRSLRTLCLNTLVRLLSFLLLAIPVPLRGERWAALALPIPTRSTQAERATEDATERAPMGGQDAPNAPISNAEGVDAILSEDAEGVEDMVNK